MENKRYTLNQVMDFNPYDELTDMYNALGEPVISVYTGEQMKILRVDAKKTWFRKVYPTGATTIEIVENTNEAVTVKASVYKDTSTDQLPLGVGFSVQDKVGNRQFPPLESAATIALGNALEDAGFGCEVSQELMKEDLDRRNSLALIPMATYDDEGNPENDDETVEREPKPEIKPLKKAETVVIEEPEEVDEFAAFGVTVDEESSGDEEKTPNETPSDTKDDQAEAEKVTQENEIVIESTEDKTSTSTTEPADDKNASEEPEVLDEEINTVQEITKEDAANYVIKPEDNLAASAYLKEYEGKKLGDMEKKQLVLIEKKLSTFMSEKLKEHIKVLVQS